MALASACLRIPLVLHESDARMGLANRLNARLARFVCVSFPHLAQGGKQRFTGNPVRPELAQGNPSQGYAFCGFPEGPLGLPVVLIWGGSLGARQINELVEKEFDALTQRFRIVHVTGEGKGLRLKHPHYKSAEYLGPELPHIYAIAQAVVGRAGANSLAETAFLGKPSLLIPLPNADQQANALQFQARGAALIWDPARSLADTLSGLLADEARILAMKKALRQFSNPQAAQEIAKVVLKAAGTM